MNTNTDKKNVLKQLGLFLVIALPLTWLLMGAALYIGDCNPQGTPLGYLLYMIACFMPAIAGAVVCIFTKESVRGLNFLPKLHRNGKAYALAIIGAVVVSITEPLIILWFFPKVGSLHPDVPVPVVVFTILQYVAIGCVQFFMLMGEEIGWMGYLFPKLEKLCGTTFGIVITGIIRALWHIVLYVQDGRFLWEDFGMLIFTNIVGGCMLVLLTKMSGSVVPASVFHAITNTIPGVVYTYMIMDMAAFEKHKMMVNVVTYVPYVIIMLVCYCIVIRKYRSNR